MLEYIELGVKLLKEFCSLLLMKILFVVFILLLVCVVMWLLIFFCVFLMLLGILVILNIGFLFFDGVMMYVFVCCWICLIVVFFGFIMRLIILYGIWMWIVVCFGVVGFGGLGVSEFRLLFFCWVWICEKCFVVEIILCLVRVIFFFFFVIMKMGFLLCIGVLM